jgi:glycolate oxidase iron-sulfur subunit
MQHTIPIGEYGPLGAAMAGAVEKCVHCGFCLPTCPTYQVMNEEMDSPRGRIILMKSVLESELALEHALLYVDRCLGCLSCVTACPSGVPYGELLLSFRSLAEEKRSRSFIEFSSRKLVLDTLPSPTRFLRAAKIGLHAKGFHKALPQPFQDMLVLLPAEIPKTRSLPNLYPAKGTQRARVALLIGCVQQVLWPEINWATIRVLAANGVEVLIPEGQGCCGALALHSGKLALARSQALVNIRAFPRAVDAVITNAAGCGSGMQEYPLVFAGTPHEVDAGEFSSKVMDVSVFLDQLGIEPPSELPRELNIAYHDACHLAHAQGVKMPPRDLLRQIPGVNLVTLPEAELCCGSAGIYNIEQPETARKLGQRKAKHILDSGAEVVVSGNIGCLVQLRTQLTGYGSAIPVLHTIEFIDRAYRGDL